MFWFCTAVCKNPKKSETRPWLKIFRFSQVWTEKPETSSSETRPDPDPNFWGLAFFLRFLGFQKFLWKNIMPTSLLLAFPDFQSFLQPWHTKFPWKMFMATISSKLPKMATFLLLKVFSQKDIRRKKVYKRRNYAWIYDFYGEWANKV